MKRIDVTGQLGIFDAAPEAPRETPGGGGGSLDDWALVYLVTMGGGNRGNLFLLGRDDAVALCEDECSHGVGRGGPWMFQWTSLRHFVHQNDAYGGRLEDFVFIEDTGKQDGDFERLGIRKPSLEESAAVLERMGYRLKRKGR